MATPIANLFDGFDLTNVLSLLRLKMGICWRRSPGVRSWPKGYLDAEKTTVLRIVELMEKSPFLKKIFEFFMGFPTYNRAGLLQAANQVRNYAIVESEDPNLPVYQSAVRAWQKRQIIPEYDLSSDDSDTGSIIVERPTPSTSAAIKIPERPRKSAQIIIKTEEYGEEEVQERSGVGEEDLINPRSKNAPKLRRGYVCIDDGSIDTSNAALGIKDESKLRIELKSQMKKSPHTWGESVIYTYVNESKPYSTINWNDRKAIFLINRWRKQVFGRGKIGSRRDTRAIWLEIEKELVLRLAGEQFQLRPFIKWNRLGNEFNHGQKGAMQPAKSNFLKKSNAKNPWLKDEREPPWRTSLAIQTKAHEWVEFWEMEKAAKKLDRSEDNEGLDSGDDEEDLEPNNTIPAPIMTKVFSGAKTSAKHKANKKPNAKSTPKVGPSNSRKRKSRLLEVEDSDSDSWLLTDKMKQKRQKVGRKNLSEIFRPYRSETKAMVASSDSGVTPAASKQEVPEPALSPGSGTMVSNLARTSEKYQIMDISNGYSDTTSGNNLNLDIDGE